MKCTTHTLILFGNLPPLSPIRWRRNSSSCHQPGDEMYNAYFPSCHQPGDEMYNAYSPSCHQPGDEMWWKVIKEFTFVPLTKWWKQPTIYSTNQKTSGTTCTCELLAFTNNQKPSSLTTQLREHLCPTRVIVTNKVLLQANNNFSAWHTKIKLFSLLASASNISPL